MTNNLRSFLAGFGMRSFVRSRRLSIGFRELLLGVFLSLLFETPAAALDWFRWRGPDLNGISQETNWSTQWPKEGPRPLWKAAVGTGFSSVSVSNGRVYTMGNDEGNDTVFCFNADTGKPFWKHSYACGLRPQYYEGGTSVTPTVDGGKVFTLSKEGHLFCFEAETGKIVWQKHLVRDIGATMPRWGFAGSPLVQGDLLILNAGSAGLALEKSNGATRWFSGKGAAGYATPVPIDLENQPCLLIFAAKALVCVTLKDGQVLWQHPWETKWDLNIADPIVSGNKVFISSFDRGAALLAVSRQGATVNWEGDSMANHFTTCILIDGWLYGIHGNTDKPPADLRCVEFSSGKVLWQRAEFGFGSLMAADGKLIVLSEKGELVVTDASPTGFSTLARAQVLGGKCWVMPVLSNGKIYCRNAKGTLVCLDVSGEEPRP